MKGIMIGIVNVEGVAEPCVALKVNDAEPVVLAPTAAVNIYHQLGEVLFQLGMFPEDQEEEVTLQ